MEKKKIKKKKNEYAMLTKCKVIFIVLHIKNIYAVIIVYLEIINLIKMKNKKKHRFIKNLTQTKKLKKITKNLKKEDKLNIKCKKSRF